MIYKVHLRPQDRKTARLLKVVWSCCLVVVLSSFAFAGTTIDPSRTIYMGRTLGMGGAHVALSNDGEGIFSNPSGLAGLEYPQISGVSRKIFLDETAYSIYSVSVPTDYGSIGFGYADANTSGSYATTRDNNNRIVINPSLEVMSYDNSLFLISYAKDVTDSVNIPSLGKKPFLVGANLKFFNQSLTGGGVNGRGTAINLDLGATYKVNSWLTTGANLQNALGGSISWNNSTDKIGGYYKFGLAANILGSSNEAYMQNSQNKVVGAFDIDLPHDVLGGSMLMHAGVEWQPVKYLAVRGGFNQEAGNTGLTLGLGLIQDAFRFDYAYAARPGIIGDNPHYFSLSYIGGRVVSYDKKVKSKEVAINVAGLGNRIITSYEVLSLSIEAKYASIIDKKTIWTVPLFSSTSETHEDREIDDLTNVYFNGLQMKQTGTIEVKTYAMSYGRHVFSVAGIIPNDTKWTSTEIKVLRFEPFVDTTMSFWAIEPIALNSVLGLIQGYPDKSFKPEKAINRAELTALLVRTLDLSKEARFLDKKVFFKDVPSKHWASNYIAIGAALGLVQGYPDGTFKPNKKLNRAEGITVLARFAKLPEKEGVVNFPDLDYKFWANKYINPARDAGILKYLEGKTFEPTREFSRAEASEVLYRTVPIQKLVSDYWEQGATPQTGTIPEWLINKLKGTPTTEAQPALEPSFENTTEEATTSEAKVKPKKQKTKSNVISR